MSGMFIPRPPRFITDSSLMNLTGRGLCYYKNDTLMVNAYQLYQS
jgi:hypothetical protein